MFGFQKGGMLNQVLTYSATTSDIVLLVWSKDVINKSLQSNFDLLSFFKMLIGEGGNKTVDNAYNSTQWRSMTDDLMNKWMYTKILGDISIYDYTIDKNIKQIKINPNVITYNKNLTYIDYHSYERIVYQNYKIEEDNFYYAFVSFWDRKDSILKIEYFVVNPNDEHLSSDMIPNKVTYLVCIIIWVFVFIFSTILMIFRIIKTRYFSIHCILILINYFFVTLYWIYKYCYWNALSNIGYVAEINDIGILAIENASLILYLFIINLIASGYKIVHQNFKLISFAKNLIVIGFFVIFSLLLNFSIVFILIFMLIIIIILIMVIRMDISASIQSLRRLIRNESNIVRNDPDYVREIKMKINYFNWFQFYIYVYWILESIVISLRPFFKLYHEWVFTLLHQVLILLGMSFLFITLNYSFKYRNQELIFDLDGIPLPFSKKKDAKLWGEIVAIHTVWDDKEESSNRRNDSFRFPSVAIGVEWSYHNFRKPKLYRDPNKDKDRAALYQIFDFEDQAMHDVLKICRENSKRTEESKEFEEVKRDSKSLFVSIKQTYQELNSDQHSDKENFEFENDKIKFQNKFNVETQLFSSTKWLDYRM